MIAGVAVGYLLPDGPGTHGFRATDLQVLSSIFLRMIRSLIVPLLFGTLVVGIAGHCDDMKRVGKLAFRSIFYFEVVTTLALIVGLLAVNIVKPDVGVNLDATTADAGADLAMTKPSFSGTLEHVVPQSFFDAAAEMTSCKSSSSLSSSRLRYRACRAPPRLSCCRSAKARAK